MAHNLATINGKTAMAYQGETPWHKLGTRLLHLVSVAEAMIAASLNWRVALAPLFLQDGRQVDDRKAVIRDIDNAVIGTVGSDYGVLQNVDAFAPLDDMCRDHGVTIESAGALGNGDRVWMLGKLPTTADVTPGDTLRDYVLIVSGHTGKTGYILRPTRVRVVCQNTLDVAMSNGSNVFSLRHTGTIEARAKDVRETMKRLTSVMGASTELFQRFASKRMNPAEVASYINSILPADDNGKISDTLKARRETIANLVWTGKGAEMAGSDANGSTLWAAYNAITEYYDHVRPAEAQSVSAKQSANESAIFGLSAQLKLKALQKAQALLVSA